MESPPTALPVLPPTNRAPEVLGVLGTFLALSFLLLVTRLCTRARPVLNLGWDDLTITVAFIATIVVYALTVLSCNLGFGRHDQHIDPANIPQMLRYLLITQPMWLWIIALIKISVALLLLRVRHSRGWLAFLWGMILVQIGTAIAGTVLFFVGCHPVSMYWDPSPEGTCWSQSATLAITYLVISISTVTDVILSLVPITFLRSLSLPLREKIVLCCLMGLGLLAAVAGIVKAVYIHRYPRSIELVWPRIEMHVWAYIEVFCGIIAACIPTLKGPFERALRYVGLIPPPSQQTSRELNFDVLSNLPDHTSHASCPIKPWEEACLTTDHSSVSKE